MALSFKLPSKRLIISYIIDWIFIVGIGFAGLGIHQISPFHRPFSLVDLNISFPNQKNEKIPSWLLVTACALIPGAIIAVVCALFVPGPMASRMTPWPILFKRKFWELNTGLMGLAMSLTITFFLTEALKNLFGRPRPDLISRCEPDISRIREFAIGNPYGQNITDRWVLITSGICQTSDRGELDDGFRSFPSGHASSSWAGLLYLTLFLCSKFAIAIPFLAPRTYSPVDRDIYADNHKSNRLHLRSSRDSSSSSSIHKYSRQHSGFALSHTDIPIRNQAAAPPVHLLLVALAPCCAAAYITSTRYTDFRHKGVDLLAGSALGSVVAYFAFRWYHLPIRQGAGWAWGSRSRDRAFGIGVGLGSYVGSEGWAPRSRDAPVDDSDVEAQLGRNDARAVSRPDGDMAGAGRMQEQPPHAF